MRSTTACWRICTESKDLGLTRLLTALLLLACAHLTTAAPATAGPNVVLILADDLGWTDLTGFGSDLHETPHLDRLARDGMKFTQNYSACTVCSPTRAALMTGKYPARLHITDWIPGAMPDNPKLLVPDWTKFLPHAETTLAEVFKSAGYTTASIGKWHLGGPEYYPETQGFDLNIAGTDKPQPQRTAELRARLQAWRREVGAQMPTPNPSYDPARPEYTPPPAKAKKAGGG